MTGPRPQALFLDRFAAGRSLARIGRQALVGFGHVVIPNAYERKCAKSNPQRRTHKSHKSFILSPISLLKSEVFFKRERASLPINARISS